MSQQERAGRIAKLGMAGAAFGLFLAGATHSLAEQATNNTPPADATAPAANSHSDQIERGRKLFADASCGTCHALHDAETTGTIGPSLDGNNFLTEELVKSRVTDGQGPMPSFGGQLSDQEIADIAVYVTHVAAK